MARTGRTDEIRKCISCNTGCVGNRIGGNKPLRCAVRREWKLERDSLVGQSCKPINSSLRQLRV